MNYSHIITSNYVSVMNLDTGTVTKITKDHPMFNEAVSAVRANDFVAVENMTTKNLVNNFASKSTDAYKIRLDGGSIMYSVNGSQEKILDNAMTQRVIKMAREGFDVKPLILFMENLMSNPSKTSIDELYLFLEATELPITSDGHFIAYKIVRNDYRSIHDGKFMNKVGTVVEMPRNEVDDNRNATCSYGLHFCSRTYLGAYGSSTRDTDRLLLVKINPADVVSIPSDYNNAKGRASKYLIWKDITVPNWRDEFKDKEYTDRAVEDDNWYGADVDWDEAYEDGFDEATYAQKVYGVLAY